MGSGYQLHRFQMRQYLSNYDPYPRSFGVMNVVLVSIGFRLSFNFNLKNMVASSLRTRYVICIGLYSDDVPTFDKTKMGFNVYVF